MRTCSNQSPFARATRGSVRKPLVRFVRQRAPSCHFIRMRVGRSQTRLGEHAYMHDEDLLNLEVEFEFEFYGITELK